MLTSIFILEIPSNDVSGYFLPLYCFVIVSQKLVVSHSIIWRNAVSVKPVEINNDVQMLSIS